MAPLLSGKCVSRRILRIGPVLNPASVSDPLSPGDPRTFPRGYPATDAPIKPLSCRHAAPRNNPVCFGPWSGSLWRWKNIVGAGSRISFHSFRNGVGEPFVGRQRPADLPIYLYGFLSIKKFIPEKLFAFFEKETTLF